MLSIRISQHFNYKPLFSGFVYLNWMNLVLLKVSAYNPQATVQQAQPRPSVLMPMQATGPELGCPNHAGSFWQWEHQPPLRRSQVPALPCLQLWLLSQGLPYVCSRAQSSSPSFSPDSFPPLTPGLPGCRSPAAAFCHFLTFAEFAQPFTCLKNSNYFFCSPGYWSTRIRRGGWETSAVLQELGLLNDQFMKLLSRGGRGRRAGGTFPSDENGDRNHLCVLGGKPPCQGL